MQLTTIKQTIIVCTLVMISFLLIAVSVMGAEQQFKTLELVRTYQSEKEYQIANAQVLRKKHSIVDDGELITFFDPETGNILNQIKKEQTFEKMMANLTATERQQMADSSASKTLMKTFREYVIPSYGSEPYLQIREYETAIGDHPEGDRVQKLLKSIVYNRQGKPGLNLPTDVNALVLAPDGQHLIAYSTSLVTPGDSLYFYDLQGGLLQRRQFPHSLLNINFSANGKHVAIHGEMENVFYIFTNKGELVFKGNYLDYVKERSTLNYLDLLYIGILNQLCQL